MIYNPSLREEPRNKPAAVLPRPQSESILDWLERNGRLAARNPEVSFNFDEDLDELNDMIGDEGSYYEEDDEELIAEEEEEDLG